MILIPRRTLAGLLVLLAATLLAGCSSARLLYRSVDWLVLREMQSYMDLAEAQRERVAGALEVSLERHRTQRLPGFAVTLRDAAARARRGLDPEDAAWVLESGREMLAVSAAELLPVIATALVELDAGQRAHLAERLAERNAEFRRDHWLDRPREERFARRAERTVDRVAQWVGPLSAEQIALVTKLRDAMPDTAGDWLAYTAARQQRVLALLETGVSADEVERELRSWWIELDGISESYAAKRERRLAGVAELLLALDRSLDSVQREHLVDRLEGLARDAEALARET